MDNDRVESDTVEEAQAESKLVKVVEDSTANFDDSKLCGLGGVGRRGEDTEVAFDFTFGTNRVEEASNGILVRKKFNKFSSLERQRIRDRDDSLYRSGQQSG